jgi:hypothetical protein
MLAICLIKKWQITNRIRVYMEGLVYHGSLQTQTLIATSTNHLEIIVLYEASRECAWLRRVINHIRTSCGIGALESL